MKLSFVGLFLLIMSVQSSYAQATTKQLQQPQITHLNNRKSSTFQNRNGIGWQTKM